MTSFESSLNDLAERISQHQMVVRTEEATKQALVLPFIQALGYDIFNPKEVIPEFIADIGAKKGEKVDYALTDNAGKPIALIECKDTTGDLGKVSETQLFRYFGATPVRFAVLTNGIMYKFYSDIESQNIMDDSPFYEADLSSINEADVRCLDLFRKGNYSEDIALQEAEQMKYLVKLRAVGGKQFSSPDDELVQWFTKQVYPGRYTKAARERFNKLVSRCLHDEIVHRVKQVIERSLDDSSVHESSDEEELGIETTVQELEGLAAIRAMTHDLLPSARIVIRDRKSYCSVIVDDNQQKPVARMYFNTLNDLQLRFYEGQAWGPFVKLGALESIHDYSDAFREAVERILARERG